MSTIGKVLVFLNLILAAAFLASSIFLLDKHENWRRQYDTERTAHEADNKKRDAEKDAVQKDLDASRNELSRLSSNNAALESEKGQLNAQITQLTTFKDRTATDIQKVATTMENYRKNNEELQKSLDEARKSENAMRDERNTAKKAQEDAENKLAASDENGKQLDASKNSLMEQVKKLSDDMKRAENGLAVYAERTGIPVDQVMIAPPLIQGNVVAADMGTKIIQLNVGSDANVKRGYGFSIYRGGDYKGEAVIEDVQPKFATARITRWVANRRIEVGDQATTRFF
jgi:septal ring factor EnvC (AmiA/AmiB activator)